VISTQSDDLAGLIKATQLSEPNQKTLLEQVAKARWEEN
jgi:hypothetical protein